MDLFRRKKKVPVSPASKEEPAKPTSSRPPRQKKRHSIGDIGLLWNNKKQTGQNDLELPLSPHARPALPDHEASKDLPVRVSKRRAPGPPKASPKRGSQSAERLSQSAVAKTTVCSTEVFHDSHIGHEVTSPASSLSGRFLAVKGHRTGSSSSGVSGCNFVSSPRVSAVQSVGSQAGAVYRKPPPPSSKSVAIQNEETEIARSLPNSSCLQDHKGSLNSKKSSSHQDLPLLSECTTTFCGGDNVILKRAEHDSNEEEVDTKFLGEAVVTWTSKNVVDWCRLKGFNDYAELFEDSDIDGSNLIEITENDLIELDFDLPSLKPFMAELEHLRRIRGTLDTQVSVEEEVENMRIEYWTNENVIHWLSISGLDRFMANFKGSAVTGVDLVKLDMEMLDRLGIISNHDREEFLARLYDTMSRQDNWNDDDSFPSKEDPVLADLLAAEAVNVVTRVENRARKSGTSERQPDMGGSLKLRRLKDSKSKTTESEGEGLQNVLAIIDAQQRVKVLASFDEGYIEQFKRACEALTEDELTALYTEIGTRLLTAEKKLLDIGREQISNEHDDDLQDYEDRLLHAETVLTLLEEQKACIVDAIERNKIAAQLNYLTRSALYDQLFTRSYEIVAVTIHHKTDDGLGFAVERQGLAGLVIKRCEKGLPVVVGDRLIELNSFNLCSASRDDVAKLLSACDWPLRLVVLRPVQKQKVEMNGPSSEEETLREDLMNVMKDLETAVEEKEEMERRNTRMVNMLRSLNNDKLRLQEEITRLQDQLNHSENDWGAMCTLLDQTRPGEDREQSDHRAIIREITDVIRVLQGGPHRHKELDNDIKLEPVPYDVFDDKEPLWETLRKEKKGVILQALKDSLTETELRRDLDNRLIRCLIEEAPQVLTKMIDKDQITYRDVRMADSYLC